MANTQEKEQATSIAGQGLADITICESEICYIDGKEGRLVYRADRAAHRMILSCFIAAIRSGWPR